MTALGTDETDEPPVEPPAEVDVFTLDQAVIDAGRALVAELMADPPDLDAIAAAKQSLSEAREARWPTGD